MIIPSIRQVLVLGIFSACAVFAAGKTSAEPLSVDALKPPTPAAKEPMPEVTDAVALFKKQDFAGALKLLKEAVKKHPELPPAQVIMAQLFSQINQAGAVRSSLESAVLEAPDDPEVYVIMGDIALRERRVTEAGLLFAKASSLVSEVKDASRRKILEPRVYSGLTSVAEARQQWATAQDYLESWLKFDPTSTAAMQRLARALFKQGKAKAALDQLKAAAAADPKVLTPAAMLARFYQQAGDHKNAKQWMAYALKVAPKDLRTRLVAAQWSLETGQLEQAEQQAAAAMQLDPKSLQAKVLRGVIALFQRDYKAAELYFESAHLQSPGNFAASNNLALALCEQPDEAKRRRALEYAQANSRQFPKVAEAASTYGWVLYKLGRLDDAERALRQAAASGNLSADTVYYIARVSADRGRKDEAKQLIESALASKRPFSQRQEAEALLKQLNQE